MDEETPNSYVGHSSLRTLNLRLSIDRESAYSLSRITIPNTLDTNRPETAQESDHTKEQETDDSDDISISSEIELFPSARKLSCPLDHSFANYRKEIQSFQKSSRNSKHARQRPTTTLTNSTHQSGC
jgi:hypothetical protein